MAILNLTFLLILAFVIFATMSAVNGLKCFNCTVDELNQLAKEAGGECAGESVDCPPKQICVKATNKGDGKDTSKTTTTRHCSPEGRWNETDIGKCQDIESPIGGLFNICFCNTDNCNRSALLQPSSLSSIFILGLIGAAATFYQIIQ